MPDVKPPTERITIAALSVMVDTLMAAFDGVKRIPAEQLPTTSVGVFVPTRIPSQRLREFVEGNGFRYAGSGQTSTALWFEGATGGSCRLVYNDGDESAIHLLIFSLDPVPPYKHRF